MEGLPAYRPGKGAAQAEREHGISDAVKLASNENPEPPIPAVVEAVARAAAGANRYPDHRAEALRSAIAGWVGAVDPAQVTVGCGSVGLLQQILLTYVDPGDEVVYPWRSFEAYPIYTQLVGGREVTVPLVDHAFDVDGVVAATTPATKVVLLASPNNPTGTAFDDRAGGRRARRGRHRRDRRPRRGVPRVRRSHARRSGARPRPAPPEHRRAAHLLQGARHGRAAGRLRHRPPRRGHLDRQDAGAVSR